LLDEWITAAGGRMRQDGNELVAELPELPDVLARREMMRRCKEMGVAVTKLPGGEARP
jgi:hypothetical protein